MRLRRVCYALIVAAASLQTSLRAADSNPGITAPGRSGTGSSMGTLILPHGPAANDLRQICRDHEEIREDRTNIRLDERLIQRDRQDIRAAEHDIKINPQNTAADQTRISADRNAIGAARSDINANRQDIRKDQHQRQQARQHLLNNRQQPQLSSGQQGLGSSNDSYGFFGPTGSSSRTHATFGRHHPGNVGSAASGTGTNTGHTGASPHPSQRR